MQPQGSTYGRGNGVSPGLAYGTVLRRLCEGFEQQPIDTMDGELFVSFWNSSDDYAMMTESEFDEYLQQNEMQMGGM